MSRLPLLHYIYVDEFYDKVYEDETVLNICSKVESLRIKYNKLSDLKVARITVVVLEDLFNPDYHPDCLQGKIFHNPDEDTYEILISKKSLEDEDILECMVAHEFGHLVSDHRIKGVTDERLSRNTSDEIEADNFACKKTSKVKMEKFLKALKDLGPVFNDDDPGKIGWEKEISERRKSIEC